MKIVAYSQRESGVGYHRLTMPLANMQDVKVHITNLPTVESFEFNPDLILYNRLTHFKDWDAVRKETSAKIIMDIDDDWQLPPNHMAHDAYKGHKEIIESNLRNADAVTVTNVRLAEKVYNFNKRVHVLPNAIPYGRNMFTDEREPSELLRLFWAGSVTHNHDLEILRNPIKRISTLKGIQMVMGGYVDDDMISKMYWDRMLNAFTFGGIIPYSKIHACLPEDYYLMFRYADAMLVPLEQSEWHGCKSNLKLLEAAGKKIPVIVSNVEPYSVDSDAPVLWVNSKKDWYLHTKYLTLNPNARIELGQQLYEWAEKKYNFDYINAERRALYASVIEA
jgi:glycosyltransferase involved in cell wall biosynthesis